YEMLAGHPPFESTDAAVLREAVLKSTVPTLDNVPKFADAAILRAMSKNPAERFENCSDFAAALGGKKVKSAKIQKKGGSGKWIAAILFFVMLGGIVFYFSGKEKQKPVVPTVSAAPAPTPAPSPKPVPPPVPEVVPESQSTDAEREIAKTIQDTYRLQAKVARQKKDIEQENYDRGQTFGRYLDALKDNFEAGKSAMDKDDISVAYASFKEAEKAAEWIVANASLRQEVQALQNQVGNQKSQADRFDAEKLAYIAYNDAIKSVATAVRYFESGDFAAASAAYKSALNGFQRAYDESRKLTVDNILDSARSCKKNQQWQKVFDHAVAALKIDSSNSEAQSLKQEAENHLKPTLEIIAMVDGKRVPAAVKFGSQSEKTYNNIFRNLQENRRYRGSLSYQAGEAEYVGDIEFVCNWRGPKNMTVALEKVVFNGIVDLPYGVTLEMVKIKAGSFTMGSPSGEQGRDSNEVQHRVTLTRNYWLGKFEVTEAQWQAVMGNNPSYYKGDDRPVVNVSWDAAKEFCNKLNKEYADKLPSGYKFDLPTEAQWEYACRAGTTTALNNGTNLTSTDGSCSNLNEVGWYCNNYGSGGHKTVGQKRPNNWGLYDMHGNVWEWCRDWYGSYNGDAVDPVGPSSGLDRVSRGGSWCGYASVCRSAYRSYSSPSSGFSDYVIGFRLALVPIQ
ncbi:MAG: SUMF1/EgtB/PvdO family nonheme iron enzyme, partial [Lentisphaeria bacterium]|nr:SUMF1/EgtB/PvdO family nonheme iron enzyme [Lentisphaeria bacterium]